MVVRGANPARLAQPAFNAPRSRNSTIHGLRGSLSLLGEFSGTPADAIAQETGHEPSVTNYATAGAVVTRWWRADAAPCTD